MTGNSRRGNAVPVSDLVVGVLDPLLRRRTGITIGLIQSWEEIVGERLAATSRPEKLLWPRRLSEDDPFEPATLVIACEGLAALHLQHKTGEVISRVNGFLGFAAVGRVKIVQKPVGVASKPKRSLRALQGVEKQKVESLVAGIEDDDLRASLTRLGASVIASRS